jgi:hypothetical protein
MFKKILITDVFTPSTPAKLTVVERKSLNTSFENVIGIPGMQVIIFGYTGSGKSTLLSNRLNKNYKTVITTRCTNSITYEQIILDAFDQLNPFYEKGNSSKVATKNSGTIESLYNGIKLNRVFENSNEKSNSFERALPLQLTPQNLGRFLGVVDACWVLEDFHKVNSSVMEKMSQTLKLFVDLSSDFPKLKIIALGAVSRAKDVITFDTEMTNRIAQIHVPLFTSEETEQIIKIGQNKLNIQFDENTIKQIVYFSNGVPSVVHQICLHICQQAGIKRKKFFKQSLLSTDLALGIQSYVEHSSDIVKDKFISAFRQKKKGLYDNGKLILTALASVDQNGGTYNELYEIIQKLETGYPAGNLSHYLKELQTEERGNLVHYDENLNKFMFSDPIYRAFALAMLKDEIKKGRESDLKLNEIYRMIIDKNSFNFSIKEIQAG